GDDGARRRAIRRVGERDRAQGPEYPLHLQCNRRLDHCFTSRRPSLLGRTSPAAGAILRWFERNIAESAGNTPGDGAWHGNGRLNQTTPGEEARTTRPQLVAPSQRAPLGSDAPISGVGRSLVVGTTD